jgi:hypothetical protein
MAERTPDADRLKDAFKRAAEIASVVPEAMQDAAFNRALDQILGEKHPASGRDGRQAPGKSNATEAPPDRAQRVIDGVNRTAYPEIASATKVLDRALAVLRLAARDFDIDGLTAPEIARVLTEKFRLRTSRQAVTEALRSAHIMVDTVKSGRTTTYRIMQAGEDHLDREASQDEPSTAPPAPRRRRKAARKTQERDATSSQKVGQTKTRRRRGPKSALEELVGEGFFSEARTINDAQEQLRHKKGLTFTLQDLAPAFVRLLREGQLDRDRNDSGLYEYRSK